MGAKPMRMKTESIDVVSTLVYGLLYLYTLVMIPTNLILLLIDDGLLSNISIAVMSCVCIWMLGAFTDRRKPCRMEQYGYIWYGILYAAAFLHTDICTIWLFVAVVLYVAVKKETRENIRILFVFSLALLFLQFFVFYFNVEDGTLMVEYLRSVGVEMILFWVSVMLICVSVREERLPDALRRFLRNVSDETTSRNTKIAVMIISGFIFLAGVIGQAVLMVCHLENPLIFDMGLAQGSILDLIMIGGWKKRIFYSGIAAILLLGMLIAEYIVSKKKMERGMTFLVVAELLSFVVGALPVSIIIFGCFILRAVSVLVDKEITVHTFDWTGKEALHMLVRAGIFLVLSLVLGPSVKYMIRQTDYTKTVTMEEILDAGPNVKGFDVLEDHSLRSLEIDPWVTVYYGQFGIDMPKNVNVVISDLTNSGEIVYIYDIGSFQTIPFGITRGDHVVALDFKSSLNSGIRLDLTSMENQKIKVEELVFNDFSYVGDGLAEACRKISAFLVLLSVCIFFDDRIMRKKQKD